MSHSSQSIINAIVWVGGSQIATRLVRIISTIVVVRVLAPELLGVAAVALASNELAHVIAKNATNSRIIRADEDELDSISNTAYTVNWIVGVALFLLQCLIGGILAAVYENDTLFYLVCTLGVSYLLLPIGQVHAAHNLRDRKVELLAKTEVLQTVCDAILILLLVLFGFGVWALVLPKLLVIPLWVKLHQTGSNWRPSAKLSLDYLSDQLSFNGRVLGVELLGVVRHNIDYILIGYFLGMHSLGIYYFAYNAGLGLSRGFITSLNNAFYPYLCKAKDNLMEMKAIYVKGVTYMLLILIPLLCAQAYFAQYYVPFLFGEQWEERGAVTYVSLLCLMGIPLLITEAGAQYIRAQNRPSDDLRWNCFYTCTFVFAMIIGLYWGLMGLVIAIVSVQFIAAPLHYLLVVKPRRQIDEHGSLPFIRGIV